MSTVLRDPPVRVVEGKEIVTIFSCLRCVALEKFQGSIPELSKHMREVHNLEGADAYRSMSPIRTHDD